jgi:hypothetical protein
LAQTHDLTVVEAAETLDDWLMFQATRLPEHAAA